MQRMMLIIPTQVVPLRFRLHSRINMLLHRLPYHPLELRPSTDETGQTIRRTSVDAEARRLEAPMYDQIMSAALLDMQRCRVDVSDRASVDVWACDCDHFAKVYDFDICRESFAHPCADGPADECWLQGYQYYQFDSQLMRGHFYGAIHL